MKAVIQIAVRRNARASGDTAKTHMVIQRDELLAPEDWQSKQIAAAINLDKIKKGLASLGGLSSDFDTVEFTIEFEDFHA